VGYTASGAPANGDELATPDVLLTSFSLSRALEQRPKDNESDADREKQTGARREKRRRKGVINGNPEQILRYYSSWEHNKGKATARVRKNRNGN
jgi:hypothetical protein